ncbi:MAG: signal peptidase I [Chloroflexi bacterium]|nr:signal peptidase I [Chloroflexota bacterium]
MKQLKLVANIASAIAMGVAILSLLGVTVLPSVLGYKTYTVLSGSMEPAIHTGAIVVAKPVKPSTLQVGDVIVYNRSDVSESVTHRIVQRHDDGGKPTFTTKGDANSAPDAWTVQYNGDTAGRIVLSIPLAGYLFHGLGSPQGRTLFLAVPVIVLAGMWLWHIWKPAASAETKQGRPAAAATGRNAGLLTPVATEARRS